MISEAAEGLTTLAATLAGQCNGQQNTRIAKPSKEPTRDGSNERSGSEQRSSHPHASRGCCGAPV